MPEPLSPLRPFISRPLLRVEPPPVLPIGLTPPASYLFTPAQPELLVRALPDTPPCPPNAMTRSESLLIPYYTYFVEKKEKTLKTLVILA
jgi:hypothetical protein